jgi:hypothetical protein
MTALCSLFRRTMKKRVRLSGMKCVEVLVKIRWRLLSIVFAGNPAKTIDNLVKICKNTSNGV